MRTTVDLPDELFRETKAAAALRGSSLKDLIIGALRTELHRASSPKPKGKPLQLPLVRMKKGRMLDLTGFDFDDLLT